MVQATGVLDVNSPYLYLLLASDFASTCVVAEQKADGQIAGFVTGYRPPASPEVLFVWQVAVAETARRQGLGLQMLQWLVSQWTPRGVSEVQATITTSNIPSRRLFQALADVHGAAFTESEGFGEHLFPGSGHEAEPRIHISPLTSNKSVAPTVSNQ